MRGVYKVSHYEVAVVCNAFKMGHPSQIGYHVGDGATFREETHLADGTVHGTYGFIDGEGKKRVVKYKAGKDGLKFHQ